MPPPPLLLALAEVVEVEFPPEALLDDADVADVLVGAAATATGPDEDTAAAATALVTRATGVVLTI